MIAKKELDKVQNSANYLLKVNGKCFKVDIQIEGRNHLQIIENYLDCLGLNKNYKVLPI